MAKICIYLSKMSQFLWKIFVLLLVVKYRCVSIRVRNTFVYEKEISEHCLRRVVPSVFLGRQAMDAYSQVLYFSKVDLPYSCFISVRAESGSNIILVVQLLSGKDLKSACDADPNQLLVYELGETFGGYWGPHELVVRSQNKSIPRRSDYTLKHVKETTPASTTEIKENVTDELQNTGANEKWTGPAVPESQDFFTIEIPLVNVSGSFVPEVKPEENFFQNENFDMSYKVSYMTTELPLVQFSIDPDSGWRYKEARNPFGTSWNKFSSHNKVKQKTRNRNSPLMLPGYRWLLLQDNRTVSEDADLTRKKMTEQIKPMRFEGDKIANEDDAEIISIEELMSAFNRSGSLTTISEEELEREVSQLLDKLSAAEKSPSAYIYNPDYKTSTEFLGHRTQSGFLTEFITTTTETSTLDHRIDATGDTMKSFAESILTTITHSTTSANRTKSMSSRTPKDMFVSFKKGIRGSSIDLLSNTEHGLTSSSPLKANTARLEKKNKVTNQSQSVVKTTTAIHKESFKMNDTSAAMELLHAIDHESWENLVRAAPVMAVRLDETVSQKIKDELEKNSSHAEIHHETKHSDPEEFLKTNSIYKRRAKRKRKKRFVQGIMIEDSKPHNLTTREVKSTTTASSIDMSDIQQFAQLVELVDDDIHGRAALRYLSQYVARPMFNLCHYEQPKPRYVHLFNSSRLVISIGNFTLRKMQLVVTPAKRLLAGKSQCQQSHLECQVNGNRVCIDAMSACDDVANCGETDIYDEDRLMCGGYMGLRHNVCLAAVAFLAVLLTFIYMVHYWLGRCVPKVSEAFFIYTEGDENVLYLDTIMRSPNDPGLAISKSYEIFDTDVLFPTGRVKESKCYSFIKKCFPCCFKKVDATKIDSAEWDNLQLSPSNTRYSFPELEIHKMMTELFKDASVQTGESLEMHYLSTLDKTIKPPPKEKSMAKPSSIESMFELQKAKDELHRIKFFNKSRKDSLTSSSSNLFLGTREDSLIKASTIFGSIPTYENEEAEISSHSHDEFDRQDLGKTSGKKPRAERSTEADIHTQKQPTSMLSKQLRFNEDVVNIPRDDNDSEEEISALQYDDSTYINTDTLEDTETPAPSTSRDFKRFWVGSKGKKKKKTQTLPRTF